MAIFTTEPGAGSLVLTGKAPSVENVNTVEAVAGSIALAGKAPTAFLLLPYSGEVTLPAVTAAATGLFGHVFAGAATLPALESSNTFGYQGAAPLAPLTISATLLTGQLFSGAGVMPVLQASGTASLSVDYVGAGTLPVVRAAGGMLTGRIFAADLVLPAIGGAGTLFQTTTLSGAVTLPVITIDATLLTGSFLAGAATFPALEGLGSYSNAEVLTYLGWSVNAFNGGYGKYGNVTISGLGRLGTKAYAAMSDGLYLLEGDDDAGIPIEAEFMLGYEDFGNEAVKAQRVAYLGYTSDGPVELLVRVDAKGEELFVYPVEAPHEGAESSAPARVKLGRGLKGRYWQMGLRNQDGAHFHIDRLGSGVWGSTRKR